MPQCKLEEFKKLIWDFYKTNKREMPWRTSPTPYYVYLSEVMLQQTQVPRVMTKFAEFIQTFPNFESLAHAPLRDVLAAWQGMGYNRRGKFLQDAAKIIVEKHKGVLPQDPAVMVTFPGIGKATAASIVSYAYNLPTVFIETNIRRIFIHHFFADEINIEDKQIFPLVADTVDQDNPREWYYALMDYGSQLPKTVENPNRRSKHYSIQKPLEGSDRQIRGEILRQLLKKDSAQINDLTGLLARDAQRTERILQQMAKEGLIAEQKGVYKIK